MYGTIIYNYYKSNNLEINIENIFKNHHQIMIRILGGQIGDIFSLCQSKIGANWQINMSAN
jgi:hypothetical protein